MIGKCFTRKKTGQYFSNLFACRVSYKKNDFSFCSLFNWPCTPQAVILLPGTCVQRSAEDDLYSLRTNFFVVPEHTPILFFYLWTFPQKIVAQIAKKHYKVTRIFKNPQIEYQNPQVKILGSWKSVTRICGLFSTDSRQH